MRPAIALSEALLALMRAAAQAALDLREPFITQRALLLAMCGDPAMGPCLASVVKQEKILSAPPETEDGAERIPDLPDADPEAPPRYDTLAFKTPDGSRTLWLSRKAYSLFLEGARRADGIYTPIDAALALAAQAVRGPGVLTAMRIEPGRFADAIRQSAIT